MCGICGVWGEQRDTTVFDMAQTLVHRGPDDSGHYFDGKVSLGHRRLSIVDLSERGRQPMSNEDNSIWLVVNGEIYNHKELRNTLSNHTFRSNSDSETIIHAYEQYGMQFLNKLRGMFALALYDKPKELLILARDPIGKKPLYVYHDSKRLAFASEIKALLVDKSINMEALCGYLMYQYTVGRQTMFNGINKVLAGEVWTFDGKLKIERYWDLQIGESSSYVRRLRDTLDESVKLRMDADVPVGSFLSGGIDSTAVTAMAAQYCPKMHTFSVGFDTFSELPWARKASDYIGTEHHEIIVTPDMVADNLDKVAWHYDEPVGDAATFNNFFLAKEARKYVKVVIAGEGGDELFGGYQHYRIGRYIRPVYLIPFLLRFAFSPWLKLIPRKLDHMETVFMQPTFRDAHDYMTQTMNEEEVFELTGLSSYPKMIESLVETPMAWDCKNLLPEKFLMKADKATMANSVEERLPLLDKNVIELAFSIPNDWKVDKYVLRRAVDHLLPKDLVERKKQGFGTPIGHWLRYPRIKSRVIERLNDGQLSKTLFRAEHLARLLKSLDEPSKGLQSHFNDGALWTIFMLQTWHDVFFERKV
jgi:asparagine synthase (glutamine-hydrolysing)